MKETSHSYVAETLARQLTEEQPLLLQKIADACQCDSATAKACLVECLRFLWLIHHSGQKLSPSLIVDWAWHEFILFTRQYAAFCRQHFGRFIHHSPGGTEQENRHNYAKTIQLYIINFGQPPAEFWGSYAQNEWNDAQCGACSN
ncbi:hypothetical protein GC194_12455 [bacterium]|nr:hypothetical protein [bacterium]